MSVHEQGDLEKLGDGYAKVVLHDPGYQPCKPPSPSMLPLLTSQLALEYHDEDDTNQAMPDRGSIASKVGGIPGWAQDPIEVPGYRYVLQINESDLRHLSGPARQPLFRGGVGFLFLRMGSGGCEHGVFFIQFN